MLCDSHSSNINSKPSKTEFVENSAYTIPTRSGKENSSHTPAGNYVFRMSDWNGHKTNRLTAKEKIRQKNQ